MSIQKKFKWLLKNIVQTDVYNILYVARMAYFKHCVKFSGLKTKNWAYYELNVSNLHIATNSPKVGRNFRKFFVLLFYVYMSVVKI
jgi:hypothetical protein